MSVAIVLSECFHACRTGAPIPAKPAGAPKAVSAAGARRHVPDGLGRGAPRSRPGDCKEAMRGHFLAWPDSGMRPASRTVMETSMTHVAVISDCPLLRRGLKQVIDGAADLRSTFVEPTGENDLNGADVAIVNLHTGTRDMVGLIGRLRKRGTLVVVLSPSGTQDDLLLSLEAGARGYVSQSAAESELLAAVRAVASGGSHFSAHFDNQFLLKNSVKITDRERQILELVASGATDREIAVRLNISQHTVHSHLDRLASKTGYRRRVDLARLALKQDQTTDISSEG
ncbi:hypothetical protein GT030_08205 [Streptomyces sp. SID1328]|nr:hypothetical protein [Streptomyces sp. SID1328]